MAKVKQIKEGLQVTCPGCGYHIYDQRWQFNGNYDKPSFTPSMNIRIGPMPEGHPRQGQIDICHSYVIDGQIRFLDDCTHQFKGQTVDIPDAAI